MAAARRRPSQRQLDSSHSVAPVTVSGTPSTRTLAPLQSASAATLLYFAPCAKSKVVAAHPSRPQALLGDEAGFVSFYDYSAGRRLAVFQPAALADLITNSASAGSSSSNGDGGRSSESSSASGSSNSSSASSSSSSSSGGGAVGALKALCFFDEASVDATCRSRGTVPMERSTASPAPNHAVCLCEHKVVLVELRHFGPGRVQVVDDFEGTRPTSVLPISSRLLAIGCSDGAVRLWDLRKGSRVRTLRGGSGDVVPVTHMCNACFSNEMSFALGLPNNSAGSSNGAEDPFNGSSNTVGNGGGGGDEVPGSDAMLLGSGFGNAHGGSSQGFHAIGGARPPLGSNDADSNKFAARNSSTSSTPPQHLRFVSASADGSARLWELVARGATVSGAQPLRLDGRGGNSTGSRGSEQGLAEGRARSQSGSGGPMSAPTSLTYDSQQDRIAMLGIDGRFATFDLSRGSPQDASIVERKYSSLRVAAPGTNNAAAGTGGSSSSSSGNSERAAFATLLSDARVTGADTAVVAVASKTGFLELVAAGSLPLLPVASTSAAASAVTGLFPQAQSKPNSKGGGQGGADTSISSAGTPLAVTLTSVHLRRLVDRAPGASGPAGLAAAAAANGGGAPGGSSSGGSSAHGGTASSADLRIAAISAGGCGGVLAIATSAGLVVLKAGWGAAMGGHAGSASAFAMHPAWSFPAFGGPYRPYGEANGSSSSSEEEGGDEEEEEEGSESSDDIDSRDVSREENDGKTDVANPLAHLPKSSKRRESQRLPTIASASRRGVRVIAGTQELWLCELYPGVLPLQDAQEKHGESTTATKSGLTATGMSRKKSLLSWGNGAWLRDVAPILLDVPLLGAPPWFTQAPPACLAPVPLPAAPFSPPDSNRQLSVAPAVLASPDGSLVALHWPFTHIYQVYRLAYDPDARLSRAASFSSTSNGSSHGSSSSSSSSSDGGSFSTSWLGTEVLRGRAISLAWVTAPSPKETAACAAADAASNAPPVRGRRNSVKSGAVATAAAAAAAATTSATTSLPPAIVYLAALEEEPLPDSGMNSGSSNSSGSSGIGVRTLGRRRATSADGPAAAGMSSGAAGAKTVLRVFTISLERQQPVSATGNQPGIDGDDDDHRRHSSFEGPVNSSSGGSGNSSSGFSAVLRGFAPPYEALCCDAPTAPGWPSSASAAAGLLGGGPLLCINFSASGGCPDPLHHTSSSSSSSSSHSVLPMAAPSSAAFFSLDPVSPTASSSSSASSSAAAPSSGAPPASAKSAARAPIRTPVLLRPVGSAVDGALPPAVALAWAPSLPSPVRRRDGGGGRGSSSGGTDCAESSADEDDEGEDDGDEDRPRVAFLCAAGAFVLAVVRGPPPRRTPALRLEGSTLSLRASPTSVAMAAASIPPSLLWAGRNMLFVSCPIINNNGGNNSTEVWALRCRDDDDDNDAAGDAAANKSYSRQGSPADFQAVLMASSAPSSTPTPATADAAAGTIGKVAQSLPEGMSECLGLVAGSLVLAPRSGLPFCAAEVPNRTAQGGLQPSDFSGWNRGSLGVSGCVMASLCTLRL